MKDRSPPFLDERFLEHPSRLPLRLRSLPPRVKALMEWGPHCFPIYEWKNTLYVLTDMSSIGTNPPPIFKQIQDILIFPLQTSPQGFQRAWDQFSSSDSDLSLERPPAVPSSEASQDAPKSQDIQSPKNFQNFHSKPPQETSTNLLEAMWSGESSELTSSSEGENLGVEPEIPEGLSGIKNSESTEVLVLEATPPENPKPPQPPPPPPPVSSSGIIPAPTLNPDPLWEPFFLKILSYFHSCLILLYNQENKSFQPWKWSSNLNPNDPSLPASTDKPSVFRILQKTLKPYHGYVVLNEENTTFFTNWDSSPDHITFVPLLQDKERLIGGLLLIGESYLNNKKTLSLAESWSEEVVSQILQKK